MHPPTGPAVLVWLETSGLAVAMRQWAWLYPIVEILHILGFVVLVGAACVFDVYETRLERYETALVAWRQRHPGEDPCVK